MQSQPGFESLQRRLQRVEGIPAAGRSPEAAALLASMQLLREVEALLPLTAEGVAALPDTPATRLRALLAILKVALADYLCPETPMCQPAMFDRLVRYSRSIAPAHNAPASGPQPGSNALSASSSSSSSSSSTGGASTTPIDCCEELAEALRAYLTASSCPDEAQAVDIGCEAAALLADPNRQPALERQLALLAASQGQHLGQQQPEQRQLDDEQGATPGQELQPLLTLQQLRYTCWRLVAESALNAQSLDQQQPAAAPAAAAAAAAEQQGFAPPPALPPLTEAQRAEVAAAESQAVAALLELEPDNPKGLVLAGLACDRRGQPSRQAADLYLRAFRLGRSQGSDWWAALAGSRALANAAGAPAGEVDAGTLEEAVAAFREVEPALRRCRRLLPRPWVQTLEAGLEMERPLLAGAEARLRLLQPEQQRQQQLDGQQARGQLQLDSTAIASAGSRCDTCKQQAAELQRCVRCRQAQYCSRECQKTDWRVHKLTCVSS